MKINILFGTESGSSEVLAEDLKDRLDSDHTCSFTGLEKVDPSAMDGDALHVMLISTTGSGDVPFNAEGFFDALENAKPDLSHVKFAIFGLGDRTFGETYNQGSERVMNAMKACGATMVGERGLHDSSQGDLPEDVAFPWFDSLPLGEMA